MNNWSKFYDENLFNMEYIDIKDEYKDIESIEEEQWAAQFNGQQPEISNPNKEKKKLIIEHPPPIQSEEPMKCGMCSKAFQTNIAFALHSIEHSDDKKYHCHLCSTFRSACKDTAEMHMKVHEDATNYKCEIPNKDFPVKAHVVEHNYFLTDEKPFQCDICGKDFMIPKLLAFHRLASHEEILKKFQPTKYNCPICNNHYTTSDELRKHKMKEHSKVTGDKAGLCDICGKKLSSKQMLKFHLRTHTGYKPYECQTCSKTFAQKSHLLCHERTHTGERPYVCKQCGTSFNRKTPLTIHERIHTGERPYMCKHCGKGFTQKTPLIVHERFHRGERPFVCKHCGKGFARKGGLTMHERIHTAEKSYKCNICGKGFISKSNRDVHSKKCVKDVVVTI